MSLSACAGVNAEALGEAADAITLPFKCFTENVEEKETELKDWDGPVPANVVYPMTSAQRELIKKLCTEELGQAHIFKDWATLSPAIRREVMEELEALDGSYKNGGLEGYIKTAKKLLEASRKGVNPLDGWEPSVPTGASFDFGTTEYEETEKLGLKEIGAVGFALVAGGLGERLGYNGIKVELPVELATERCYLEYYCQYILNIQSKYAKSGKKLPLCIMVSKDTNVKTVELLEKNNYFGMDKEQVSIVQQGRGVPAVVNNEARFSMDGPHVVTKPHGHGDIHSLFHSSGIAKAWSEKGINYLCFIQDTNGLAFNALPLMLGVSSKLNLIMNSLCVPRKAKQAIGGIAKLTNTANPELVRTQNVEYNQLDPLLRASGFPDGDVNDESTGFSPFPGNINQLLFQLKPYVKALESSQGLMPDFVNPKYADDLKSVFKKPARLECMMQDFPTVLSGEDAKRVGFTSLPADMCFSPVKNAVEDGKKLQDKGTHPAVAATGEADQYGSYRNLLKVIGCKVEDAGAEVFNGISSATGPEIVFKPRFVACLSDCKEKFPFPYRVKISPKSSLVISGSGVVVESLELDGALVIECPEGQKMVIKDLVVKNKGWERVPAEDDSPEFIKMRGYDLVKTETCTMVPGGNDAQEGACIIS